MFTITGRASLGMVLSLADHGSCPAPGRPGPGRSGRAILGGPDRTDQAGPVHHDRRPAGRSARRVCRAGQGSAARNEFQSRSFARRRQVLSARLGGTRMKLVIFGLTISSSWGNGHATLWRGLCKVLARRGHQVVFFERDVPYYALNRDLVSLSDGELCLYPNWEDALPLARWHLADADVAMVTSYCPDGVAAADVVLEAPRAVRTFYDLDTPVTLARLEAGEPVEYIGPRGLGEFDLVFSYTGGRALAELQKRLGARRVAPLYGSVDPDQYRRTAAAPQYLADLSYMGTYAADRQPALEQLLVEPARRLRGRRFLIGGAQYPQVFPWTDNIFFVRHLPPGEHPAFYSSSRLTLNIT